MSTMVLIGAVAIIAWWLAGGEKKVTAAVG
jgi:hypothetical protein